MDEINKKRQNSKNSMKPIRSFLMIRKKLTMTVTELWIIMDNEDDLVDLDEGFSEDSMLGIWVTYFHHFLENRKSIGAVYIGENTPEDPHSYLAQLIPTNVDWKENNIISAKHNDSLSFYVPGSYGNGMGESATPRLTIDTHGNVYIPGSITSDSTGNFKQINNF